MSRSDVSDMTQGRKAGKAVHFESRMFTPACPFTTYLERCLALLEELRPITGAGRLCFPSFRSPGKLISENTLNATLRLGTFE
jgi:hypothetical protein